ncbi:MAG: epoxyqueuosine reductase QueH [Proteobacteria bacterium]|nr:epoxyqueuosine reductase QueH [Pseudomonadota bacterium]MBU1586236.1 epoxyqueuosine reductase QueH [Pseudomonadota bacterium]MBU2628346.1 epoxyqueuosine reductase QueH [Pseudomonadota bacterium]
MKLLLHTCCAPCSIYPVKVLREMDMDVMGFFYRHNIHPFQECQKRQAALELYSQSIELKVIFQKDYRIEKFLQSIVFREKDRCRYCYYARLEATALVAKKGNFNAFSTTLLYSRFQNHDCIRETGEAIAKKYGLKFFYQDFREGWKFGIETSKRLNMYRQQYCGCIYSEKDRYFKE